MNQVITRTPTQQNKKKITVTVGIPAFNEEANIGQLIKVLLSQANHGFTVKEILVVSDGSTDHTVSIVKAFHSKRIKILAFKDRKGQALRQNEILKRFKSEVLVLLNADVMPVGPDFLQKLILPIITQPLVGLVGARVIPLPAQTWTEAALNYSAEVKLTVAEHHQQGRNIYTCHGRARAFRREFAKSFQWERVVGEDAFSYLACLKQGWQYWYEPEAEIVYRSPQSLQDHLKQSVRFFHSQLALQAFYGKEFVSQAYRLPFWFTIFTQIKAVFRNPWLSGYYMVIFIFAKLKSRLVPTTSVAWEPSTSSKILKIAG